jgi:hypothetical protein
MISDKAFHGALDQRRGCPIVFDKLEADDVCPLFSRILFTLILFQNAYGAAIGTICAIYLARLQASKHCKRLRSYRRLNR